MTADVALVAIPVYSHDLDFKTVVSLTQAAAEAARVDQADITLHHTGKMTYLETFIDTLTKLAPRHPEFIDSDMLGQKGGTTDIVWRRRCIAVRNVEPRHRCVSEG